ncbi:MAG: hypothetical protein QOJ17_1348, partial [Rhodospirillaceae bacterium]|nr:hypothetical protein [Rhodospirillaceae bacterium]
ADGEARIGLLPAFRAASLLTDALAARSESDAERAFDGLPAFRRQAFAGIDALNGALKDALERPSAEARLAALKAAGRATAELDRLAGLDDAPLILSFTPRFVPPRRTPDVTGSRDQDPPVQIEVVGPRLASTGGPPPVLAVGAWRGAAVVAPERLRFAVPRSAFATDPKRTLFATGTLSVRGSGHSATFQLLLIVLPDSPGAFALDQRVQTTAPESNTLVSPEILARAPPGETRTVRRCFDPPSGWRFDQERRRVVIVERLGWQDDVGDPTLNGGSVEFVPEEKPGQICLAVTARPVIRLARTATIGRFEATLVRDRPIEQVVKSGIRALDWREPVRVPIEPGMTEWKLYVRLFDEIDREFTATGASTAFLRITRDDAGQAIVLQADPAAEP